MATDQADAAMRQELEALSDRGATLAELSDHLGKQNRRFGAGGFSDGQEEELELYCWALHRGQSSGALLGHDAGIGGD